MREQISQEMDIKGRFISGSIQLVEGIENGTLLILGSCATTLLSPSQRLPLTVISSLNFYSVLRPRQEAYGYTMLVGLGFIAIGDQVCHSVDLR